MWVCPQGNDGILYSIRATPCMKRGSSWYTRALGNDGIQYCGDAFPVFLYIAYCVFCSKGGREFSGWALRPHGNDSIMYNLALSRSIAFMEPS
jgi:hypothetical protein